MDIGRSSNTLLPMRATCFPEAAMHVQSRFRLSSSDGDNERTKIVRSWTQVRLGEQHVACSDAMRPSFLVNLEVDTFGPLPTDHYRPGDVQTKSSHDPVNAFEQMCSMNCEVEAGASESMDPTCARQFLYHQCRTLRAVCGCPARLYCQAEH